MKRFSRIAFAASMIVALYACNDIRENVEIVSGFETHLVFTATNEGLTPDTKTQRMDDGSSWWNASEEISVFYGSGSNGGSKFTSLNNTFQEIVEFDGSIQMSGAGKDFWAVYPYSTDNSCDGSSVTMTIPASQEGVDGNFSNDVFPTIAKSKTLELAFWNVCGGVKFFVSRNDIKSISFEGNNGEILAGKVKVSFNAEGVPEVTKVIDGQTEVVLTAPDGGCFKTGKYYYISLLPVALNSGFTISFRTDTAKGQVISNNSQTIKRSVFGVLKNIDSKVQNWEDALPLPDAVDLGLSVLWATFNVGASAPEEYGNYYAYGETEPKDWYTSENYIAPTTIDYSSRNSVATRTVYYPEKILSPDCDAAHVAFGGEWRMPTRAECEELVEDCTSSWTTVNGNSGFLFTSKINGNSIFLPGAGFKDEYRRTNGIFYWSSSTKYSPYFISSENNEFEPFVSNSHYYSNPNYNYAYFGQSVRAVRKNSSPRHVGSLTVDKTEISLYEGRTENLIYSVLPETAVDRKVVCSSSNPDVASVSWRDEYSDWGDLKYAYAYVKALKAGTAIITVTTVDGGLQASCNVTVMPKQEIEPVDLGLSVKWASMNLGSHGPEEYGYSADDSYHEWVYDMSSNHNKYRKYSGSNAKSSLDVEDDVVHVTLGGNWRMPTIEEWRELVESCTWSWTTVHGVSGKIVTSSINGRSIFLPASGYICHYSDVRPMSFCGEMGYYWSSTTKIGSNGRGQALLFDSSAEYLDGEYYYGAENQYNQYYNYYLSVRPVYDENSIHPDSVYLNKSGLTLYVDYSEQLTATVLPSEALNKDLTWVSSDKSVVVVSKTGVVTGVSPGTATVTVYTVAGNKSASCVVTVVEPQKVNGYVLVDLGLSVKWATCNIGASKPEESGSFFAWGETEPKSEYGWSTYKFIVSENSINDVTFSKYCTRSPYWGCTEPMDNKIILDTEDDAGHVNLGDGWRMPTDSEWTELMSNCTWSWTGNYNGTGVAGHIVTSNKTGYTDQSIFLPAADRRLGNSYFNSKSYGEYWSSILNEGYPDNAETISFGSYRSTNISSSRRCYGHSVRPVYDEIVPVSSISIPETTTLPVGMSETLTATVLPENATYRNLTWSSSDESVATVDATGKVTAVATGKATITAYSADASKTATCEVTVVETAKPEAVDLGLPSGLKWATMNVGATKPEDYGDYYAWGETQPKSNYNWSTYKWCNGSENTQTKYNTKSSYGSVDNKTVLDPEDDVASVKLGGKWRMPTVAEWTELRDKCTWIWTTNYKGTGVKGRIVTATNGNSIFLPATGIRYDARLDRADSYGYYWSSSLDTGLPDDAYDVRFNSGDVGRGINGRCLGQSIRPVSE